MNDIRDSFTEHTGEALAERLVDDFYTSYNTLGEGVGPELEDWDAVRVARWRRFERIARQIADGIPFQMLASIYINDFEQWADEQEDASTSNAEAPIDEIIGTVRP